MSPAQDKQARELEEKVFASVIPQDHAYRKLNRLIDFESMATPLQKLYSKVYPIVKTSNDVS